MPNINSLFQLVSQKIILNAEQNESFFTTKDLKYAYNQLNGDPVTARHCNFQKAVDTNVLGLINTRSFLDDILILSCGTLDKHMNS